VIVGPGASLSVVLRFPPDRDQEPPDAQESGAPLSDLRETLRLAVEQVTARLDPHELPFATTDELYIVDAVFGQERAVRSIEFALGMETPGYNLFASGPDGIGKSTIVESFLRNRSAQLPAARDWFYVHNFENHDRPIGISLPAGQGRTFANRVEQAVESSGRELRAAFESDDYARQRQGLVSESEAERQQLLTQLQSDARGMGFALQMTQTGIVSAPLINDEPVADEVFKALPEAQREEIQAKQQALETVVQDAILQMRGIERTAQERFEQHDQRVAAFAINHLFQPLLEDYGEDHEIEHFLQSVRDDIRNERDRFRQAEQPSPMPALPFAQPQGPPTRRYAVNVVVTHDPENGAPVVRETHPTYYNLLGRIEYQGQLGTPVTDHTMIRAGSLVQANGGFLMLRLRDLLMNPMALDGLKRALAAGELAIENLGEAYGLVPTSGLRPEPIPLEVKVVLVGEPLLYSLLYRYDPDFRELFRVKADFETDFDRSHSNAMGFASFVHAQCESGGLRCFTAPAVSRLIEHSSRLVEHQEKLSANMSAILDVLRQADYWAGVQGTEEVGPQHVNRALEERVFRSSLVRDRLQEAIDDGSIYVETSGEVAGQINALSVYDLGDISFGRPSRITCVTSAGRGSMVMVERESDMAGRIHNKGFLILRGFLADRFSQLAAGSLHASLTFEQLYGDIDGDSASSTELYALLSSLSGVPISQSIAVTGSVDQYGRIQPIGGATAKIEGFYEVARSRGLDGSHGVMIPQTNAVNVVLRPDVAKAIEEGQFHIWTAETIEQGIELLTGVPAGERGADGKYPEGSIYGLVEKRLDGFYHELKQHEHGGTGTDQTALPARGPQPQPPGVPPPPPPEPPIEV
jgi:predicted ATP-dependent protease